MKSSQVSEVGPDGSSRVYRRKRNNSVKDRSEWIAVPVPYAGIPLDIVEAARRTVCDYKKGSKAAGRFWELSGAIARCSESGRAMVARPVTYKLKSGVKRTINYYRRSKAFGYNGRCEHTRVYRAEDLEARVWALVLSMLRDPERLRAALDRLIDEERKAHQGDPRREAKAWLKKIAEADRTRGRFQDMAAQGLITFDELRAKLAGLDAARKTASRELDALAERRERLAELERDRAAVLESYSVRASRGLDYLTPEDRHQVYKKLRLAVSIRPGGDLEIRGVLRETEGLVESTEHPGVSGRESVG